MAVILLCFRSMSTLPYIPADELPVVDEQRRAAKDLPTLPPPTSTPIGGPQSEPPAPKSCVSRRAVLPAEAGRYEYVAPPRRVSGRNARG